MGRCDRCGVVQGESNMVRVCNAPSGMGNHWCRECVAKVNAGELPKLVSGRVFSSLVSESTRRRMADATAKASSKAKTCGRCGREFFSYEVCAYCGSVAWKNVVYLWVMPVPFLALALLFNFAVGDAIARAVTVWPMGGIAAIVFFSALNSTVQSVRIKRQRDLFERIKRDGWTCTNCGLEGVAHKEFVFSPAAMEPHVFCANCLCRQEYKTGKLLK